MWLLLLVVSSLMYPVRSAGAPQASREELIGDVLYRTHSQILNDPTYWFADTCGELISNGNQSIMRYLREHPEEQPAFEIFAQNIVYVGRRLLERAETKERRAYIRHRMDSFADWLIDYDLRAYHDETIVYVPREHDSRARHLREIHELVHEHFTVRATDDTVGHELAMLRNMGASILASLSVSPRGIRETVAPYNAIFAMIFRPYTRTDRFANSDRDVVTNFFRKHISDMLSDTGDCNKAVRPRLLEALKQLHGYAAPEPLISTSLYSTLLSAVTIGGCSLLAFFTFTGTTKRFAMRIYRWARGRLAKRPVAARRPRRGNTDQSTNDHAVVQTTLLRILSSTAGHALQWLCALSVSTSLSLRRRLVTALTPEDDKAIVTAHEDKIHKLTEERLGLHQQLMEALDKHKQEREKSQQLDRQLREASRAGSAREAELRAEIRRLTVETTDYKQKAEQARNMHECDKQIFRSRLDELIQQLRDQRAVSESMHEDMQEMRRLVVDLMEQHDNQSETVPPEPTGPAEEEPRSSQAAAVGNENAVLPNSVEEGRRSGALEDGEEFRAFVDAVYAQLACRAEGYTDVNLLLSDFYEYSGIRGEEVARSFGFHSFENFLRSTYMSARVLIENHPEVGTLYKQRPDATNRHLHREQAISMEHVTQRRINEAVRRALERQRGDLVRLQQELRAEKAKLQKFTSGVMQSKFARASHFSPSSALPSAPSIPPGLDEPGEADRPSTSSDDASGSGPECSICLEIRNPNGETLNATIYKCGHRYHYSCIVKEMAIRKTCPQCRQPIADVIQSY